MKKTALSLVLFGALHLTGCGQDAAAQLDKGMQHMAVQDYRAASIEFKAVLQNDRQNLLARAALAELHNQVNDMSAEEKELIAILEADKSLHEKYRINKTEIAEKLARVYVRTENVNALLEMDIAGSPEIAYLKTLEMLQSTRASNAEYPVIDKSSAYAELQKVAILLKDDPQSAKASLSLLNIKSGTTAFRSDAALLAYSVASANREAEQSLTHLAEYVDLNPFDAARKMQLAHMYISTANYQKATPLVDSLLVKFSRHALVNEMKAILLYQDKKYDEALKAANTASIADPNTKMARIIAAYSAYQTGKTQQALTELEQVAPTLDGSHPAKRLYIQLRAASGQGRADDLVSDALSLTNLTPEDVALLSQMGLAMAQQGKMDLAKKLEEKASTATEQPGKNAAALGMLQLSIGDKEAFSTLEAGLLADSSSIEIGNTLASAYLANNKIDEAWRVAETIAVSQPIQSNLLKAVVFAQRADHASAVDYYKKVLSAQPKHPAASAGLVESLVFMEKWDEAKDLLTDMKAAKGGELSYRHYLGAMKRADKMNDGADVVHQLVSKESSAELQLVNAQAYFVTGDWAASLSALEANTGGQKYNEYWLMRVGSLMQQKDKAGLADTYSQWLKAAPSNQMALMGRVSSLVESNEIEDAILVLDAHQQYHQEKTPITLMKFHLQVMSRKFSDAKASWETLPSDVQKSVIGQGLFGILDVVDGRFDVAIPKLEALYQQAPSEQYVSWLYFAHEGRGDIPGGIDALKKHLSAHPDSSIARAYLGNAYAQTNQYKLAQDAYLQVIKSEPNNTLVLNNLAFVMIENGEYVQSEAYAKQALLLVPGNESVLDTLANAVLKQGRKTDALTLITPLITGGEEDSTGVTYLKILTSLGKQEEAKSYYESKKWGVGKPDKSTLGF